MKFLLHGAGFLYKKCGPLRIFRQERAARLSAQVALLDVHVGIAVDGFCAPLADGQPGAGQLYLTLVQFEGQGVDGVAFSGDFLVQGVGVGRVVVGGDAHELGALAYCLSRHEDGAVGVLVVIGSQGGGSGGGSGGCDLAVGQGQRAAQDEASRAFQLYFSDYRQGGSRCVAVAAFQLHGHLAHRVSHGDGYVVLCLAAEGAVEHVGVLEAGGACRLLVSLDSDGHAVCAC